MKNAMHAAELLKHFAMNLGLPDLRFDSHGCVSLCVDGHIEIHFEHDAATDAIHLYSCLAELPATGRETLYLQLLEANLLGTRTAGATLAVNSATQQVVLCRQVTPHGLEGQDFLPLVRAFVDASEHWMQLLDSADRPSQPTDQGLSRLAAFA